MNRVKLLYIPPQILVELLTAPTAWRIQSAVPDDARVLESGYAFDRRCFYLVLEHPSFDPVPDCELPPVLPPPRVQRLD